MRAHTQEFKNQIKELGREIDSRITYGDNVITSEELYSIKPIVNAELLKSVMKELDFETSVNIPQYTIIKYEFGLLVNGSYEYLDYGNYVVYSSEYNEDTKTYSYVCYDYMLFAMKDYINLQSLNLLNKEFPMTIKDYIGCLCADIGLVFANSDDTFANCDKVIESDLYANLDYTYRDIFDELSQVTASNICINNSNQVEIRYLNDTNDIIDEEYLKDINVKFGEKFGAINTIVLTRSGGSDSIYYPEILPDNPVEIKIEDNQIMNFNNRDEYMPDIYEKLNGLEYYLNDFTSTGILYYELCDRYNVKIGEKTYNCVLFNDEVKISQGLTEDIYTVRPEKTTTDYTKSDKTDRKINQAYLIVDKQNKTIQGLTSKVYDIQIENEKSSQNILEKFDGYTPLNQTLELEKSVTQIQTDTYTKTEINTKLTDGSVTMLKSTTLTADDEGLTVDKNDSKTKSNLDADGLEIIDKTGASQEVLLEARYDENLGETIVRSKNMRVEKYLNIGTHSRIEDYEDGTGIFYIG